MLNDVPKTGYTAYYNKDIPVTIKIDEDYAAEIKDENDKLISLEDLKVEVKNLESEETNEIKDITWSEEAYTGTFTLSDEGEYQVSVSYKDAAHNPMVAGGNVQGAEEKETDTPVDDKGVYTSTNLVIDKTAPTVSIEYLGKYATDKGYKFYGTDKKKEESVKLTYTEKYFEENIDSNGNTIYPVIKAIRKVAGEDGEKEITLTAKNSETDTLMRLCRGHWLRTKASRIVWPPFCTIW